MNGLTDVHQHLLFGLDDGAQDEEIMRALLREAHKQNIRRIFATPHACPGFKPFDAELYRSRLTQAKTAVREMGLDIDIRSGAEIAWTYQTVQALEHGRLPTLGESDCALIEFWPDVSWDEVFNAADQLTAIGILPLFAHVERYRCFVLQPGKALALKERFGAAYQVNASTILSGGGIFMRRFMKRMLDEHAIDAVASDAHNCSTRPQRLGAAYEALCSRCGKAYAGELVNFREVLL